MSINLRTLIEGMLEIDELDRLSLSEIMMSDWFNGDTIEDPLLLKSELFFTQHKSEEKKRKTKLRYGSV